MYFYLYQLYKQLLVFINIAVFYTMETGGVWDYFIYNSLAKFLINCVKKIITFYCFLEKLFQRIKKLNNTSESCYFKQFFMHNFINAFALNFINIYFINIFIGFCRIY